FEASRYAFRQQRENLELHKVPGEYDAPTSRRLAEIRGKVFAYTDIVEKEIVDNVDEQFADAPHSQSMGNAPSQHDDRRTPPKCLVVQPDKKPVQETPPHCTTTEPRQFRVNILHVVHELRSDPSGREARGPGRRYRRERGCRDHVRTHSQYFDE